MKTLYKYSLAVLLSALFITSCSPEQFGDPRQDEPTLGAYGAETTHDGLEAECGNWIPVELTDSDGSAFRNGFAEAFGRIELNNDHQDMAIRLFLGNNWFIDHANIYYGELNDVLQNGQIDIEGTFQVQEILDQACNSKEWNFSNAGVGDENDYIFSAEVARMGGFFNGLDESTRTVVWANANSFANGFSFSYTFAECATPMRAAADQCARVYKGYEDAECTDLTLAVTGGKAPYTYSWNTGESTPTIQVCPSQTTTYSGTITDAQGNFTKTAFTVNVEDVSCGNNGKKVQICHVPPGNPANTHGICVSKSAVAAHVHEDQGHSGCYLGACNAVNPCQ